jgi:hypothetical protein
LGYDRSAVFYYPSVSLRLATIRGADPLVRSRRPRRLAALVGRLSALQKSWSRGDQRRPGVCLTVINIPTRQEAMETTPRSFRPLSARP